MSQENTNNSNLHSIAIIGCGPRGISVLERLAARLSTSSNIDLPHVKNWKIHIIDAYEVGAGRIWRKEQPQWLLMNTPARETTMFSGPQDKYGARPGAGPSLSEWWVMTDRLNAEPDGIAPRAVYGKYLNFVFNQIIKSLSKHATVNFVQKTALDLQRTSNMKWKIIFEKNKNVIADRVLLTTGHSLTELSKDHCKFQKFSQVKSGKNYMRGDSVADMDLTKILPHSNVGIMGCGLAFYDVMISLTEGRGGRFLEKPDGEYDYEPSGLEPKMHAGSRSSIPFPARAINQKAANYSYTPMLFTAERISHMRKFRKEGKLNFKEDVLPWIEAEMQMVQAICLLQAQHAEKKVDEFIKATLKNIKHSAPISSPKDVVQMTAIEFGVSNVVLVDIKKWANPFYEKKFNNSMQYVDAVKAWICQDILNSEQGNLTNPVKISTDLLRDIRSVLKLAVDFGGLTPESHRDDFLSVFFPMYSMLSAGPPVRRLKQLLALINKGFLVFVGPMAHFSVSDSENSFLITSPKIPGSKYLVDTLIDARIPAPDIHIDISPLTKHLLERGIFTSFINTLDTTTFDTGGVAVTPAPFHPITSTGPEKSLYVLGIPTEYTRWLTHIGSGRPGQWGQFIQDADAIASDIIASLLLTTSNDKTYLHRQTIPSNNIFINEKII